jgi:hypothetical protein
MCRCTQGQRTANQSRKQAKAIGIRAGASVYIMLLADGPRPLHTRGVARSIAPSIPSTPKAPTRSQTISMVGLNPSRNDARVSGMVRACRELSVHRAHSTAREQRLWLTLSLFLLFQTVAVCQFAVQVRWVYLPPGVGYSRAVGPFSSPRLHPSPPPFRRPLRLRPPSCHCWAQRQCR